MGERLEVIARMIKLELSRYYRGRLILFINGNYVNQYGLMELPEAYRVMRRELKRRGKLRYKITLANGSTYSEGSLVYDT